MEFIEAGAGSTVAYMLSGAVVGYILYSFFIAKKRLNRPVSENTIILTDGNFEQTIKSGVVLVDFWAGWCGPCKVQGPIVDEIADEIGDKAKICKLDIDQNQKAARTLGIQNIPTILLFNNGELVKKFVGVKPKGMLLKAIQEYI